ncbi:helix-turn-helix domain-containing protein [bacterium M00.F.Ca.ET.228.01.1.1]|uniref:GlxA family transcriptional regulator n=1 Tax=Burkholderiaceae TaxID=119060 RepID=UPI00047027BB|nr:MULTISPECIES: helix-turn-helix domain-containing protein [Burkholderiaceae]MBW9133071.1 helix-turn-helix domain-containing protein [Paraburkholderia ginsengiterrae]TGP41234.1 helix-turn-helix domain-containing protein [bacterium M00.F.Ca.ET.228.01.1.1]TGR97780.1 helix-turn-helix domain-containing protein [bacterium M00.F.Ca.ET.191.01.1.1]TGU01947.1 helix-turn-helix domain-containing protein [bacterium M00.F.Ca.ET.155.01.1.1]MBW0450377.1 helix-turn-helix domain-containing protein [Paraburkho
MSHIHVDSARVTWLHTPTVNVRTAARRIGVLLFDGFWLLGPGTVVEMFQTANELAGTRPGEEPPYEVQFLSLDGGSVPSSSAARIWTDRIDTRYGTGFDVLFIAGGHGAHQAARDQRLLGWLRSVQARTRAIETIGEGRLVLEAANPGEPEALQIGRYGHGAADAILSASNDRNDCARSALMFIKRDLGAELARSVAERVMPGMAATWVPLPAEGGTLSVAEKIRAAARWMEANCDRPVSVADAAQVAAMSERNFLRRFKHEMHVTPSDYLLQVRLRIACNFLTETELPVDKIARRSGTGNGDRLAKIFRKRMALSPTEYRARSRLASSEL